MRVYWLLIPLLLLLPSCLIARLTNNEPLEEATIEQLVVGTTTAREAVELLGAPTEVVQLARRSAYRYEFTRTKRAVLFLVIVNFFNDDTHQDRMWLFFDEDEILTHFGTTLEADEAAYAMPWFNLHDD